MKKLAGASREDFNKHLQTKRKQSRTAFGKYVPLESGQWRMGRIVDFSRGDPVVKCVGNPYVILAACSEKNLTKNQRVIYEVKEVMETYAIGQFKEIF
jgi:hypothetical protein